MQPLASLLSWLAQSPRLRLLASAALLFLLLRWSVDTLPQPLTALPGQPPPPPRLHHFTVSTRHESGLYLLLESAARFGYRSTVLGLNETRPLGHWAKAFGLKMILMREAVAQLPQDEWVLFTDAFDVVFQRPAWELLQALEAWAQQQPAGSILFTAEKYEWPDVDQPYTTRQLRLPFLNSGVYAGRARDVLRAVSSGYDLSTDDQRFFTQQYLAGGQGAPVLDHAQEYFASMASMAPGVDFELLHREAAQPPAAAAAAAAGQQPLVLPVVVPTPGGGVLGRVPYILHFNGGFGKEHFFLAAGHVLGERGAFLAERAAWIHGLGYWLLLPFRLGMIYLLPWRLRSVLRSAGLTDTVALLLPVLLAGALRWWWVRRAPGSSKGPKRTLTA